MLSHSPKIPVSKLIYWFYIFTEACSISVNEVVSEGVQISCDETCNHISNLSSESLESKYIA